MPVVLVGLTGAAGSGKDAIASWLCREHGFMPVALADEMKRFVGRVFPNVRPNDMWGPSHLRAAEVSTGHCTYDPSLLESFVFKMLPEEKWDDGLQTLTEWWKGFHLAKSATVRALLQSLGTEWGRSIDPDMWWRYVLEQEIPSLSKPETYGWDPAWGEPYRYDGLDHLAPLGEDVVITDVRFENEARAIDDAGGMVWRVSRPGLAKAAPKGGIPGHVSESGIPDALVDLEIKAPEGLPRLYVLLKMIWDSEAWCPS